jgi:hypothetical protein
LKFGKFKCDAKWTASRYPESAREETVFPADLYKYRVSATLPPFSTSGSRSSTVRLDLLVDHVSRYSEYSGDIEEFSTGDFVCMGSLAGGAWSRRLCAKAPRSGQKLHNFIILSFRALHYNLTLCL